MPARNPVTRDAAREERLRHEAEIWERRRAKRAALRAENAAAEAGEVDVVREMRGERIRHLHLARPSNAGSHPCTADTARCATARDAHRATAPCCKRHMVTLLRDVTQALDAAGVPWWLDYGALLGWVLVGGCYWNDKDVDVCVLASDRDKVAALMPAWRAQGHPVKYYPATQGKWAWGDTFKVQLSRTNSIPLDITLWERDGDWLTRKNWAAVDQYKGREMPVDWVFPLATGTWEELPVTVPAQAERLVAYRYGPQWRSLPDRRHGHVIKDDRPTGVARSAEPAPRVSRRAKARPGPKVVAVIVAAHAAEKWIGECLDSVAQQEVNGWCVDVRVGVDGCPGTAALLRERGTPHWFWEQNVGAYVMRNSLIALAPADVYAIFDADDVMLPGYLESVAGRALKRGMAATWRHTVAEGMRLRSGNGYYGGVAAFSAEAWDRLGGFRPWRMAADWDAVERAKAMGMFVNVDRRQLYRRRQHPQSLTRHPDTKVGSPARARLERESKQAIRRGLLYVEPRTVPLSYWEPGP